MAAAVAAMAANQQGKFWEFHKELFANYNKVSDEKIDEIAQSVGLNMEQFKQDMKNSAITGIVQRDLKDGALAGVRGTPSIFVNGRLLQQRSPEGFKNAIDAELAGKKKQ